MSQQYRPWGFGSTAIFMCLCCLTIFTLAGFTLLTFFQAPLLSWQHSAPEVFPAPSNSDSSKLDLPSSTIPIPKITTSATSDVQTTSGSDESISQRHLAPPEQFSLQTTRTIPSDPVTRDYIFNITRGYASPGRYNKSVILVNGQTPGPLIEAKTGDTIRVVVNNLMLNESTSIHWHGIDQRNTVWMDGVYGLTQCGIPPGKSFVYQFVVADQRGTFWYHSHLSLQNTDGLYGPLIIHDPEEKIRSVQKDHIVMIGDLYHNPAEELLSQYLSPSPPWSPTMSGMEPPADNVLFNGHHQYNCSANLPSHREFLGEIDGSGDKENGSGSCTGASPYSVQINSGDDIRLRLINHGTFLPFWFSVDNHTLEIVETDGVEIEPITTSRVFIYPGQRYSVILTANQASGNYHMRATAARWCFDPMDGSLYPLDSNLAQVGFYASEVLSYNGTQLTSPVIGVSWDQREDSEVVNPWKEECEDLPFDLPRPMRRRDADQVGDVNHNYFEYQMVPHEGAYRTIVNQTMYIPLSDDATLWRVLKQDFPSIDTDVLPLQWTFGANQQVLVSRDPDSAAQIVINSKEMMAHPWHLHDQLSVHFHHVLLSGVIWRSIDVNLNLIGQTFQVVGWGKGMYGEGNTVWNLENPLRRDTVTIPGGSHLIIRVLADNPGIWAFHCHLLWHAHGGMFVAIAHQMERLVSMLRGLEASGTLLGQFCSGGESKAV